MEREFIVKKKVLFSSVWGEEQGRNSHWKKVAVEKKSDEMT